MNFKFLPNLITLFNLFLGCIVTLLLIENNLEVKYVFTITVICLILDYLDELIDTQTVTKYTLNHTKNEQKRVLKEISALQKEMDSIVV